MLTPEQLQNLPQELTDLYDQLSEFILRDIARRIAKGAQITDTRNISFTARGALGFPRTRSPQKSPRLTAVPQRK